MPSFGANVESFSLMSFIASVIALGDRRLDARVVEMVRQSLTSSKASLPAMFGKEGSKAAQRLMSNSRVSIGALREALYACSLENLRRHKVKTVVSIFDPTLLDFSFQERKSGRMPIGDGAGRGYQWLNALLVEPEGGRVLGVGHQVVASSFGLDDEQDYVGDVRKKKWQRKLVSNHPNQFLVIANAVDARLPEDVEIIHVADREMDDGLVLRSRVDASPRSHFVIRANDTRVVQVRDPSWLPLQLQRDKAPLELDKNPDGLANVLLADLARHLPCPQLRTLALDSRGRVCSNPENSAQTASLQIGAVPIRLARKSARGVEMGIPEQPVWLNLVVVREAPGRANTRPILWLLLTDLPTDTAEQVDRIVLLYSRRWRVEEFFRTEKDAMHAEDSQLDDPYSTARLLVFLTFKAMFLDELRFKANIPAGVQLTKQQHRALETGAKEAKAIELARREGGTEVPELSARRRAVMALGLIAAHGAWTGRSLGNFVLLRGLPLFIHDVSEGRYAWLLKEDVG